MTRIIALIDNLDYAADGTETPAEHTIVITWQVDGGKPESREMDLTDAHLDSAVASLEDLTEHANPGTGSAVRGRRQLRRSHGSPVIGEGLAESKKYRARQREYADAYGITALDGPERPAYQTPSGATYWPAWLDVSYQWFLDRGDVVVPVSRAAYVAATGREDQWKSYVHGWSPAREPRRVLTGETK